MNVVAIIQARLSSERLPEKVLKQIEGIPMIKRIVIRVGQSKRISKIIVATSDEMSDDKLYEYCVREKINVFRGELDNVLKRYYDCATQNNADIVVRLTGDNVLVDSKIIDRAIDLFLQNGEIDYFYYCKEVPLGLAVEVFSYAALQRAYDEANNSECKEHVTVYMYTNSDKFKCVRYSDADVMDNSTLRWTTDTQEDYELVKAIYHHFGEKEFHYEDVIEAYKSNPNWRTINDSIQQKKVSYVGEKDENWRKNYRRW